MIIASRTCIACRRLIPEDYNGDLLTISKMKATWNTKKHKHTCKYDSKGTVEVNVFCETCAGKMADLIKGQIEKGIKVI